MLKENKEVNSDCDCQLISVYKASSELNSFDKAWLIYQRICASLIRRVKKMVPNGKSKFSKQADFQPNYIEPIILPNTPLQAGDWVQVLAYAEIEKTLGKDNLTQGLHFFPAMKKYCGSTRKVLKRVNYMFDERTWKMIKIKNVVLLEGTVCDGKDMVEKEGCGRSCFWYWKEAWLKKI